MISKFIEGLTDLRRIEKPKEVGHIWIKAFSQYFRKISRKDSLILKMDLWNEVVATNKDLTESLHAIKPKKVVYVEREKELCRIFSQKKRKSDIINGDISKIPLKEESTDIVIDISTSDHLPLQEFKEAIKEYWRVLKKDGNLILFHFNKNYFNVKKQKKVEEKFLPSFPRKDEEITRMIKKTGFHICKKRFFVHCLDETFVGFIVLLFLKLFRVNRLYDIISYKLNSRLFSLQIGYLCSK